MGPWTWALGSGAPALPGRRPAFRLPAAQVLGVSHCNCALTAWPPLSLLQCCASGQEGTFSHRLLRRDTGMPGAPSSAEELRTQARCTLQTHLGRCVQAGLRAPAQDSTSAGRGLGRSEFPGPRPAEGRSPVSSWPSGPSHYDVAAGARG